jgi:hypothetical protein
MEVLNQFRIERSPLKGVVQESETNFYLIARVMSTRKDLKTGPETANGTFQART